MNTQLTINTRVLYRTLCAMLAAVLVVAGLPLFQPKHAAAAQMSQRTIQLSDAGASANAAIATGVGSGVGVTYRVSVTTANTAGSMVIDFCSNNPIISDTCTAPTGMATTTATLNSAAITGQIYAGNGWSVAAPSTSQIKLARDANASHDIVAGQQVFELSGITNPSTVGSFYARIYTYQGNTFGSYSSATAPANAVSPASGGIVDYGGVALSTSNTVSITARVQETLSFCVTKAVPTTWNSTHDCSDPVVGQSTNYPALTLGHGTGTPVLDQSTVDQAVIYSQLSTNANSGAVINMRNSNGSCGGLSADNGATCAIPAVAGSTSSPYTAGPITAGGTTTAAAFGMFVSNSSLDPAAGGVGSLTPTAAYHSSDAAHNDYAGAPNALYYGMDNQTTQAASATPNSLDSNVKGTYGSTVAYTTTPISRVNLMYVFGAVASLTTPAGIYTANLSMIATGTF